MQLKNVVCCSNIDAKVLVTNYLLKSSLVSLHHFMLQQVHGEQRHNYRSGEKFFTGGGRFAGLASADGNYPTAMPCKQ